MAPALRLVGRTSQALSYVLGGLVLVAVVANLTTAAPVASMVGWAVEVLSLGFCLMTLGLVFAVSLAWTRLADRATPSEERQLWLTGGMHAANAIANLALTYTLFGISIGISSLAERSLTPETIPGIIKELTHGFSMAFMTTVVGLPLATALRALLSITAARRRGEPIPFPEPAP